MQEEPCRRIAPSVCVVPSLAEIEEWDLIPSQVVEKIHNLALTIFTWQSMDMGTMANLVLRHSLNT